MEEILNKVEKSGLITFDLEDFYPKGKRILFDLKPFLFQELILKEKDFRTSLLDIDWNEYKDAYVSVTCSVDAIIPSWAYILVATYMTNYAKKISFGSLEDLERDIYTEIISTLNFEEYKDKKIIIKGCSNHQIPQNAYLQVVEKMKPLVSSLMFGEACSTVPLYKRNK